MAQVIQNRTLWLQYYQQLLTGIIGMGQVYQYSTMVDILNEPDAQGLTCAAAPPVLAPQLSLQDYQCTHVLLPWCVCSTGVRALGKSLGL